MKQPIKPGLFAAIITLPLIGWEAGALIRDADHLPQHLPVYIVLDVMVFAVLHFVWSKVRAARNRP
ncbi:hypothetical protein [Arthrobacter sp.]|uniref:hypothetical protein n=1 Tax=Arthrobacter sp. TaxID=1667 RepID=UPI00258AD309|nr:hypothetical protein [Arthrobacter sp.]